MKKFILFAFLVIFSLCAFAGTPDSKSKSDNPAFPDKKENKMSENELNSLRKPPEEIRDRNNSPQTIVVREGRNGRRNRGMNRDNRRHGNTVFVGGGALLLVIILIIILV